MLDNDLVEIEHVYQVIDVLVGYRAGRIAAALQRDEDTDENLIKAEVAYELILEIIQAIVPGQIQSEIMERMERKSNDLFKSITFSRKGA